MKQRKRNEIDIKDTWDLTSIYKNDDEFNKDYILATNDKEKLYPTIFENEDNDSMIKFGEMGKYKNMYWCEFSEKDDCPFSIAGVIWDNDLQKYRGCNVVARAMRRVYNERNMIMGD